MIIGLTGKKGCGKSSVARILRDNHGFKIMSFAQPIKDMLEAMGVKREALQDPCLKELELPRLGKSPRQLMQLLGTEFGRELIHPNIWIYLMEERLKGAGNVVIDDVRFHNEAEMIRERNGGKIVEILRGKHLIEDNHISERGLDINVIDAQIRNTSCYITDLENRISQVVGGGNEAILS